MNSADDSLAELWRWTGADLARGIRTRRISSREAVESCLVRIAQVNPHLNALVEVSPDEALAMADAADRAVAEGATLGPLHGVPVAIKVNSDQAGHATTNGMVVLKDAVATVDSPQVQKLREAGAVFVARSNTPAFSLRWFTDNALHGRTLNPWDAGRLERRRQRGGRQRHGSDRARQRHRWLDPLPRLRLRRGRRPADPRSRA